MAISERAEYYGQDVILSYEGQNQNNELRKTVRKMSRYRTSSELARKMGYGGKAGNSRIRLLMKRSSIPLSRLVKLYDVAGKEGTRLPYGLEEMILSAEKIALRGGGNWSVGGSSVISYLKGKKKV